MKSFKSYLLALAAISIVFASCEDILDSITFPLGTKGVQFTVPPVPTTGTSSFQKTVATDIDGTMQSYGVDPERLESVKIKGATATLSEDTPFNMDVLTSVSLVLIEGGKETSIASKTIAPGTTRSFNFDVNSDLELLDYVSKTEITYRLDITNAEPTSEEATVLIDVEYDVKGKLFK